MRTPWDVGHYPVSVAAVCTYGIHPPALEALAAALVGSARMPGRLPVARVSLRGEILEQPDVARRFLGRAPDVVGPLADAIRSRGIDHVVIAARGTSDHAAIYAQYVLGIRHGLSVGLGTPSVISLYGAEPISNDRS